MLNTYVVSDINVVTIIYILCLQIQVKKIIENNNIIRTYD